MADPAPGDVVMSGAHEDDDVVAAADGEIGGVDEAEQIDAADLPENVVGTDAVDAMDAMDAMDEVKRVGFVECAPPFLSPRSFFSLKDYTPRCAYDVFSPTQRLNVA